MNLDMDVIELIFLDLGEKIFTERFFFLFENSFYFSD
jgi:hypothetical protein